MVMAVVSTSAKRCSMTLVSGARGRTGELVLITELSGLSRQIGTYVLRTLDADAGRADAISADDEHRLGARLIEAGTAVHARATKRLSGPTEIVVIESNPQNP